MAIPPAGIQVGCCYSGSGDIDRRVVSIDDDRVHFESRASNSTEAWGKVRVQNLRAFARLVYDRIDCETGKLF